MMLPRLLRRLKDFDEQRPSVPGEHWLALGAGALLLLWAARKRSWATAIAGAGMVARAAAGRDGVRRLRARVAAPHTPLLPDNVTPLRVGQR
jgi:uncharacterized membrane protein